LGLEVFTIGHSTHELADFLRLLHAWKITAIADVRSAPVSAYSPHFNRDRLRDALRQAEIVYVFLGRELGGRPSNKSLYTDGIADYEKMAAAEEFEKGLRRVIEGAKDHRVALMCSEHNPLDCHRCLLIGRVLAERSVHIQNILGDGSVIDQGGIERRLLEGAGRTSADLFASRHEQVAMAYRERAKQVAYAENRTQSEKSDVAAE